MDYTSLGKTGLQISEMALGTMNFGSRITEEQSHAILDKANDLGINFIDTANAYGKSETIIGRWLKSSKAQDDFIISSKVGWPMGKGVNEKGLSRGHILKQVASTKEKLNVDQIDIYQPHFLDNSVSVDMLAKTFSQLVDNQSIGIIGAPLFAQAWKRLQWYYTSRINGYNNIEFQLMPFSLLSRSIQAGDTTDICEEYNIPIVTFGVLGGGLLTGKYTSDKEFPENGKQMMKKVHEEGQTDTIMQELQPLADDKGISVIKLSLAWVLQHEFSASSVIGVSSPDQLEDIMSVTEISLTEGDIKELERISQANKIW